MPAKPPLTSLVSLSFYKDGLGVKRSFEKFKRETSNLDRLHSAINLVFVVTVTCPDFATGTLRTLSS